MKAGRVNEAAMKRRQYLRKKARVVIPGIAAGCVGVWLVGTVLKIAFQHGRMSDSQFITFILCEALMVVTTFILISSEKRAAAIPRVPAVQECIDELPADEVLLRGSAPQAALAEELVRPAQSLISETRADGLLRPMNEEPPHGRD